MENATILTESFDPERLAPGLYVAESTSEAYALLRAMVEYSGMGQILGERYASDGVKVITVRIGGSKRGGVRPNAIRTMPMSRAFLVNVLKDYTDWKEKWWRECVQNSVDAGAKNIALEQQEISDGSVVVSCTDDGTGMDVSTILEKFLVFGESTKTHGGMAGGFGKAKEMLLLPWIWWRIESNGQKFEGVGNQYEEEPQVSDLKRGTRLSVCMPADMCTDSYHASAFLEKCNIPGVKFTVQLNPTAATQRSGKMIREFEKAKVYHNKSATIHGIFVRTHGLYMFSDWLSSDIKGAIFVEITAPSIEVLSSNRDSFRDRQLSRAIDELQNELAVDVSSALTKKSTMIRERYRGSGMLVAEAASSAVLANMPALPTTKGGAIEITTEAGNEIADTLIETLEKMMRQGGTVKIGWGGGAGAIDKELAALMLTSTPILGQQHVENVTRQLAWEPDFYLMNKIEGYRVPKKFKPDSMTPMVLRLAKVWAELCRYALVQLNYSGGYGIGFVFDENTMASYNYEDGEKWLLVNPFAVVDAKQNLTSISTDGPITSYAKDAELKNLYASAIHEVTHMVDGISAHNEVFSSAFTKNVAICAEGFRTAKKIASLVGKRKIEGEEGATKAKKATRKPKGDALVDEFLEGIALAAAGHIAGRRQEERSLAKRSSLEEWAIGENAVRRVGDKLSTWESELPEDAAASLARDMLLYGRVALSQAYPNPILKADLGAEYHDVVVLMQVDSDSMRTAWTKIAGGARFDVVVDMDTEVYHVTFE